MIIPIIEGIIILKTIMSLLKIELFFPIYIEFFIA
jgi:hypothetical protein